ncbi:carboxylesterase family protein [Paenibacillus terreus]|uniref:Carboxylic ester hydrolase n=1 Tax=Paenibacillus terreus TaxID=1387834 RepID=A0ABV5BBV5_9BACL
MKGRSLLSALLIASLLIVLVLASGYKTAQAANKTGEGEAAAAFTPKVVQQTKFGKVKGYKDEVHNTLIWKGVPYGGPTSGAQRWKKPTDPKPWKGELNATKDGDVAIQAGPNGATGSESALNLDIYRPANHKQNLPVMVFIHGGNNQGGGSGEIAGNSLVNDIDAIFVSVNYRLGPLGFNPLPALHTGDPLEDSGNYALLDIAKSLDWVKENIGYFGGDAGNVTVSGFSAGGRDVMAMLASPIFKDKFDKAISFSGGMTIADKTDSAKVFAKAIAPLAVQDGKKKTEEEAYRWLLTPGSDVKKYLYSIPAEKLAGLMGNASIRMSVFPHLYNDGVVLPKEGFDTTVYNSVPLLMLTGEQEFSLFARSDRYFADSVSSGAINTHPDKVAEYNFVNRYGGQLYSLFNVEESARAMKPHYPADIYGVEIEFGSDPYVAGEAMAAYGSFHGVFMPLLNTASQNYKDLAGDGYSSAGAKQLSVIFQKYIGNFLKTGNPNGDDLVTWKAWTEENAAAGQSILKLDANRDRAIVYMSNKEFTYEDVLQAMDNDHTISAESKQALVSQVLNGRWFSQRLDEKYNNPSLWVE